MKKIIDGVSKFQKTVAPAKRELLEKLSKGQWPEVLFITCSDSRVAPNLITQTEPGDLFVIRNAGNIVPPHAAEANGMSASVEYAVAALEVGHIVVCGHTGCGAMKGAMNPSGLDALPQVRGWLKHAEAPLRATDALHPGLDPDARLGALVERNVLQQIANLQTHPYVAARTAAGNLQLHGWVYAIESGNVLAYDASRNAFSPLAGGAAAANEPPAVS